MLHCFISYSVRARSSACFFVGVSSFISFCCYCFRVSRRKKGSKCNHAHTFTTRVIHAHSIDQQKNAFTHIGMQFKIIYSNCIICGAVFHAVLGKGIGFLSGSACREMARASENDMSHMSRSIMASQPVNQCMSGWCRFHCVSSSNGSRWGLVHYTQI